MKYSILQELRKQLENQVLTIDALRDENRASVQRHENVSDAGEFWLSVSLMCVLGCVELEWVTECIYCAYMDFFHQKGCVFIWSPSYMRWFLIFHHLVIKINFLHFFSDKSIWQQYLCDLHPNGNNSNFWAFSLLVFLFSNSTRKLLMGTPVLNNNSFHSVGNERTQRISFKVIPWSTKWVAPYIGGQTERAGVDQ